MFIIIIIIFIPITQQPEQDRWAENQPTAGLSSLNEYEYENEYENGMRRSRTELKIIKLIPQLMHKLVEKCIFLYFSSEVAWFVLDLIC